MRRTAALLATALLAGAAALTAPAAQAAGGAAPRATPPAPVADAVAAENCSLRYSGFGVVGTCTGLDPEQTWTVAGVCQEYPNGVPVPSGYSSSWTTGDGVVGGVCFEGGTLVWSRITFGPKPVAGPRGPITGYGNKCVDVRYGSNANGTPVQIYDCLGNAAQTWKVAVDGTVRALGKCLDVQGGVTDIGTPVQIYDCNGGGAQQWRARPDGSLFNPMSGRCLDLFAYNTGNASPIVIWDCNGAANQVWHLPA
ncbi:Ricin-type beta-trefoil lectin domain-containing protein [Streptomyces sp. TLI_053]|uniref:ricin-type beta-trefoil lectin domain protein n=1 Tax=Streptomyces sp. TLI_053 TaxID=1855352 RepID=UPI00087D32EF|nr:ricin-type beta-trefoil lectin domain protein [Streptomyces sp. TLI_053]SDT78633.1 Ricin-type beta-trefoil lectin domain-containing protein [Streptomyces sp. TLI_053]